MYVGQEIMYSNWYSHIRDVFGFITAIRESNRVNIAFFSENGTAWAETEVLFVPSRPDSLLRDKYCWPFIRPEKSKAKEK